MTFLLDTRWSARCAQAESPACMLHQTPGILIGIPPQRSLSLRMRQFTRGRAERCLDVWKWQILLQNSAAEQLASNNGNNRIRPNGCLNRYCALMSDLESMLLARTLKIVLQHYLPFPDIC